MAGSVNKVILVGTLAHDPEVRTSQDGRKTANLSIATSETWTDKQSGERRERTEWHHVVVLADHATSVVEKYLRKGSRVYVEGKLQTRKWQDASGAERATTEVAVTGFGSPLVLLDSPNSNRDVRPDVRGDDMLFGDDLRLQTAPAKPTAPATPTVPATPRVRKPKEGSGNSGGLAGSGDFFNDDIPFAPELR